MEPDYAPMPGMNKSVLGAQAARRETTLGQIEFYADKLENAANAIELFIARFRGLPAGGDAGRPPAVPSGHEGQLSRIGDQLNRLDGLANALNEIG